MRHVVVFIVVLVPVVATATTAAHAGLPAAEPASVGLDPDRLARIDVAIDRAIERGQVPGAVVLVGRRGKVAYARAFGHRAVEPRPSR